MQQVSRLHIALWYLLSMWWDILHFLQLLLATFITYKLLKSWIYMYSIRKARNMLDLGMKLVANSGGAIPLQVVSSWTHQTSCGGWTQKLRGGCVSFTSPYGRWHLRWLLSRCEVHQMMYCLSWVSSHTTAKCCIGKRTCTGIDIVCSRACSIASDLELFGCSVCVHVTKTCSQTWL